MSHLTVAQVQELLKHATNKANGRWNGQSLEQVLVSLPQQKQLRDLQDIETRELSEWEKKTGYIPTLGQVIQQHYRAAFGAVELKWFKDLQDSNQPPHRWFSHGMTVEDKAQYRKEKQARWVEEGQQARANNKNLTDNPYSRPAVKQLWPEAEAYWAQGWSSAHQG